MDVIKLARELGAALQQDERYLAFRKAQEANESDSALQELIAKLQFLQVSFQHEAAKEDKDEAKLQEMDTEFGQLYSQIMANPNMQAYEASAAQIDNLMKYINAIFTLCLQGQDPETCEPQDESGSCTGNCGTCGGCQ